MVGGNGNVAFGFKIAAPRTIIVRTANWTPKLLPAATGARSRTPSRVVWSGAGCIMLSGANGHTTGTGAPRQYAWDVGLTNTKFPGVMTGSHTPKAFCLKAPAATTTYLSCADMPSAYSNNTCRIYWQVPRINCHNMPTHSKRKPLPSTDNVQSISPECQLKYFRWTWGPPDLQRAIKTKDPRHITRAPRKPRKADLLCAEDLHKKINEPGVECIVLRYYSKTIKTFTSWYKLLTPVPATVSIGLSTDPNVKLLYDSGCSRQCARFYKPQKGCLTHFVKVTELRDKGLCEMGAQKFKLIATAAVDEEAFHAADLHSDISDDAVAQLSRAVAFYGIQNTQTLKPFWDAVTGERPICMLLRKPP